MPSFIVSGLDRDDGSVRFTTVTADSADDAARLVDFVVEKAEPVPSPTPSQSIPRSRQATPPPSYPAMLVFALLFMVVGYTLVILGSVALVFALLPSDSDEGWRFTGGAFAFYALSAGLGIALAGELLRAFRDMARNSFK